MITSIRTGSQVQVVAACALYAVACLAHEVDVLFLPLFLLVTWLAATNSPHRTFCLAAGG